MHTLSLSRFFLRRCTTIAAVAVLVTLAACSPKYDWREVRGTDAPFVVLLPAKPATLSRPIDLDGSKVTMTMTAAEVDGVTFAVGTAQLSDAAHAQAALSAMKAALVKNIGGTIKSEKTAALAPANGAAKSQATAIDIEASGAPGRDAKGQPRMLVARFIAQDQRVYQVVVVGREKAVTRDAIDTFITSFKLN